LTPLPAWLSAPENKNECPNPRALEIVKNTRSPAAKTPDLWALELGPAPNNHAPALMAEHPGESAATASPLAPNTSAAIAAPSSAVRYVLRCG